MDVRRDANAHGVTVVELRKTGDRYEMVKTHHLISVFQVQRR